MSNASNHTPATTAQFPRIPLDALKIGMRVHVKGWAKGAVFTVTALEGTCATIQAAKTKRTYEVHTDNLLSTNASKAR